MKKLSVVEIKRATLSETGQFSGYASTWDGEPDAVGDVIKRGAFTKALAHHKRSGTVPALLWGHDLSEPVGRWLSFTEDSHGLLAVGKLTLDTRRGREAYALLKDDALSLSIGYTVSPGGASRKNGLRIIKDIARLYEVSLVSIPANGHAKITSVKNSSREFEKALRERLGLSVREAKRATSGGWHALVRDEQPTDLACVIRKIDSLRAELIERGNL